MTNAPVKRLFMQPRNINMTQCASNSYPEADIPVGTLEFSNLFHIEDLKKKLVTKITLEFTKIF